MGTGLVTSSLETPPQGNRMIGLGFVWGLRGIMLSPVEPDVSSAPNLQCFQPEPLTNPGPSCGCSDPFATWMHHRKGLLHRTGRECHTFLFRLRLSWGHRLRGSERDSNTPQEIPRVRPHGSFSCAPCSLCQIHTQSALHPCPSLPSVCYLKLASDLRSGTLV